MSKEKKPTRERWALVAESSADRERGDSPQSWPADRARVASASCAILKRCNKVRDAFASTLTRFPL